ncbi:MAG: transcriptional regulator [Promethearchaeota archaeon]|jgi:DNA-binding MarR family transcriptional regulator
MAKKEEKIDREIPSLPLIDKLIHEPARLDILAALYVIKESDFIFLKNQTGMTWGNLSSHLTKLEDAGYVRVKKELSGKKTKTRISLTDEGRIAFREYRRKMDEFLKRFQE